MDLVNLITDAICVAINGEFGDDYVVYTESVKQGLKEPCFFVTCVSQSQQPYIGLKDGIRKRYLRENQFCIQYIPEDPQRAKAECHGIAERLEECLEYITVAGDLTAGTGLRYEVVDEILDFYVNYDMFIYRDTGQEPMEDVSLNVTAKG